MKKTVKTIVALLTAAALLFALAACGAKTDGPDANLMQSIYEKLTANKDYAEWKATFNATTFEEKLDGNTITVLAVGEEGVNGEFAFTLDGDYIVNTAAEGDYASYAILMEIMNAVAEHYGMNASLMRGYIAGLDAFEKENTFFTAETADGKTNYRLYAAKAWDMAGLDDMYINEKALAYTDALTDNSVNNVINTGKISLFAIGSKTDEEIVIGEYGENTELTLKSLQNVVAKLQPVGYEAFAKDFTELKEGKGNGYTVTSGIAPAFAENHEYQAVDGYSYFTVVFTGA